MNIPPRKSPIPIQKARAHQITYRRSESDCALRTLAYVPMAPPSTPMIVPITAPMIPESIAVPRLTALFWGTIPSQISSAHSTGQCHSTHLVPGQESGAKNGWLIRTSHESYEIMRELCGYPVVPCDRLCPSDYGDWYPVRSVGTTSIDRLGRDFRRCCPAADQACDRFGRRRPQASRRNRRRSAEHFPYLEPRKTAPRPRSFLQRPRPRNPPLLRSFLFRPVQQPAGGPERNERIPGKGPSLRPATGNQIIHGAIGKGRAGKLW
jgi:hypothetical protein